MQRLTAIIRGRVQGVYFRGSTQQEANRLDVTGWVANQWDGTVKVVAEGPDAALERLLRWLHHGPPHAHVEYVEASWTEGTGEFRGFQVRR
jgi:acylphosphatase